MINGEIEGQIDSKKFKNKDKFDGWFINFYAESPDSRLPFINLRDAKKETVRIVENHEFKSWVDKKPKL